MRLPDGRVVRAWIGAGAGVIAAVATAYLLWVQLHPEAGRRFWEIASITAVGILAIGRSVARPLHLITTERLEARRHKVSAPLRGLPWTVHELTDQRVPVRPLGASAWVVTPWWPFQRLKRIAHERVNETPGPSQVRWTKGKGVIGHCWAMGREQTVNTGAFDQAHARCTREEWDRLDVKTRRGMTYKDYRQVRGKYGTVIAVPMFDQQERMIGVVALDSPVGFHEHLSTPSVIEAVGAAAGVVSSLIE